MKLRRTHTGKRSKTNRVRLQDVHIHRIAKGQQSETPGVHILKNYRKTDWNMNSGKFSTCSTNTEWLQYCSYQMVQMQEEIEYQ